MNMKKETTQDLDALWRAYVESDPDLCQIERQKRASDKRQAMREYARAHRAPHGKDLCLMALDLAGFAAFLLLCAATFLLAAL